MNLGPMGGSEDPTNLKSVLEPAKDHFRPNLEDSLWCALVLSHEKELACLAYGRLQEGNQPEWVLALQHVPAADFHSFQIPLTTSGPSLDPSSASGLEEVLMGLTVVCSMCGAVLGGYVSRAFIAMVPTMWCLMA